MTEKELMQAIRCILPGAELGEDNDGQLVIYTGLREDYNSERDPRTVNLIPMDEGEGFGASGRNR